MKSVLITGCNRGIGLALVKHLLKNQLAGLVIATCRNLDAAENLTSLTQDYKNLRILQLDVKEFNKYDPFVKDVSSIVGAGGLNVLINNAGIATKFARVGLVKAEQMSELFLVNATAPLMLTKACLPLLKAASSANSSAPVNVNRAAVINMSSILGSIAKNDQGGHYPYKASKSALNAVTRSLSIDLKEDQILVMSMHPGWVRTDMGGNNAPLEVGSAVDAMIKTILSLTQQHNGGFYDYQGNPLPW